MEQRNRILKKKSNSVFYGAISGTALLLFFVGVVTIFQGFEFAILNLRSLWYLIFPLAMGFGIQIGLYTSIRHDAKTNMQAAASGGVSGGAMIACCSHFILNILPFAGAAGLATVLMAYQRWFLVIGLAANVFGIAMLLNRKKKMKGGKC